MKNRLASAAATIGVALLAVGTFGPQARAATIESYDVGGSAQGVVMTAAIRPSIFDPLAQAGNAYAEATLSSQGGGTAGSFAAQIYPGKFGIGAVGCSGTPFWHQAQYPAAGVCKEHDEGALAPSDQRLTVGPPELSDGAYDVLDTVLEHTAVKTGHMMADAHFGESHALVRTQNFAVKPDVAGPPAVTAEQVLVTADGLFTDAAASHRVRSIASGISLLNGVIRIGSVEAVAETSSDGIAGAGKGTLTIKDVEVLYEGDYHRATIDNHGVRINDPEASRSENLGKTEQFNEALLEAGIAITVGEPIEVIEGPSADASVGGLLLSLRGTVPSARVPTEVAPIVSEVIKQIPTRCLNDPPVPGPLPLCFGPGVLPGFGSQVVYSIEIGSAISHTVAFPPYVSTPIDPCVTDCGFSPPQTFTPGGPVSFPPPVDPGPGTAPPDQPGPQPTIVGGPRVGLVARLPASALMWTGAGFLILAVGAALAPSLRDAGAR